MPSTSATLAASIGFVVGFGGHAADQFFKVAFAGVQDGAAVVGVHAEHQPFTVGVEQH